MKVKTVKRLLVAALSGLAIAACASGGHEPLVRDTTPVSSELDNKDRVAILNTAWGVPKAYSKAYRAGLADRAYRGPKQMTEDEACTDMYFGEWPYRVKQGLLPFSVGYRTPKYEMFFDNLGVYRLDKALNMYINVLVPKIQLTTFEVDRGVKKGVFKVAPASTLKLPIERLNLGPDPRTGEDYISDFYTINHPNGLQDLDEISWMTNYRLSFIEGLPRDMEAQLNDTYVILNNNTKKWLVNRFGGKIDYRDGYYEAIPGKSERHDDLAVKYFNEGFTNLVVSRETSDYNNYAINTMGRDWINKGLCEAGIENGKDINQEYIRQVGRTPEYNVLLADLVGKHITKIPKGEEVSILYINYGMPWPGGNPKGPMSSSQPLAKETFHENGYNNYLSAKHYLSARFDQAQGGDWKINYSKAGGMGGKEARTRSLYGYGMEARNKTPFELDPLDFSNVRENLDVAVGEENRKNIIIVTSHWFGDNEDTKVVIRDLNKLPYNSKEDFKNEEFWISWCERYTGDREFEQKVIADNGSCDEGWTRITLTDVFHKQIPDFAVGYAARIRGGVERFGVFPELDVDVIGKGEISKDKGGIAEIKSGKLAGAKLMVRPDYKPGIPEDLTWYDLFKPKARGKFKNISPDAFRPFNEFTKPEDHAWSAWNDFTAYIGTQGLAQPGVTMTAPKEAVSEVIYFGPYRTLFNAPAEITMPYDKSKVKNSSALKVMIYNDLTLEYDPVYPVPGGQAMRVDELSATVSFDVQVLGNFVVVEG
ncbi:MAG: hypothetical protein ACJA0N_001475 [Pseudohongiellaceae bacterium]|jgi:hypothetical protein